VLISLTNSGGSFSASEDEPLLDAARDAGLNLPHSCKGGNCGACKARLLRGEIHYPNGKPLGLSDAETAEGMILLCQARARSDLTLETFQIRVAGIAAQKRLPCRIERAVPLSHDVMGLFLRLPIAEDFSFAPGQYIDILLPGGRRRSFSIASPPHDARPLELHVRHVAGGEFTDRLFHHDMQSSLLMIEGPLGEFVYHPHSGPAPPMLLIGGGTGIAPRDVTPEATVDVCDRLVEGIAEQMRFEGMRKTRFAALSRAVCGVRGTSLILNLPGSPTGAVESLEAVIDLLPHALELIAGRTSH